MYHHPSNTLFFSIQDDELITRNRRFCHHEVDTEYGSYFCSDCDYIVHVDCALSDDLQRCLITPAAETEESESEVLSTDSIDKLPRRSQIWAQQSSMTDGFSSTDSIVEAVEGLTIGETSESEALLSADEVNLEGKSCERCLLPVSGMVYFYQDRDVFIHETCGKLARKKQHWAHRSLMALFTDDIFRCDACRFSCTGFGYRCGGCDGRLCLRCSMIPDEIRHESHKPHPLIFHYKHEGPCSSCGQKTRFAYRCKDCNLTVDFSCLTRPSTAMHWQHEEHPLTLVYQDEDEENSAAQHYCDICQEERNPSHWFYGCRVCNKFKAHPGCVLGEYPFVKRGDNFMSDAHEHPLTSVDINNDYYNCEACGDDICDGLALRCSQSECSYIVHWKCMPDLRSC